MQTELDPEYQGTPDGDAAEAILRRCVHCGFCTATCPTYQLLGDELDGPRGRIYLIKQVLEGATPTTRTQQHLDRCLTCRSCETTCPSGVQYGELVEIGRRLVDAKVERPRQERLTRWALREGLTSPLFGPALQLGQRVRGLLPAPLKNKVPERATPEQLKRARQWPTKTHERKVLMLLGCVQPTLAPNINSATARVLDAAGIQTLVSDEAGCCGAIRAHLNDQAGALTNMRRNIDAWWPQVAGLGDNPQVEAIVFNASGCGVTVKEYGHALAGEPEYAEKARRISALAKDISELLPDIVPRLAPLLGQRKANPDSVIRRAESTIRRAGAVAPPAPTPLPEPTINPSFPRLAYHPPCTLQHGQKLRGGVEAGLRALGFDVQIAGSDSHLCCGSAGTYSVLQPELAYQLRDRKLAQLTPISPKLIVSGNIGCIQHLQTGTAIPVRHWIEVLDEVVARLRSV
jgi:glycolate oxidase iron-sulfur subunit